MHPHTFQYFLFKGNGDLIKSIVVNLAIFTNSSSFMFTERESADTLWAGAYYKSPSLKLAIKILSPTQEVFHTMDQQLMLYIAIT